MSHLLNESIQCITVPFSLSGVLFVTTNKGNVKIIHLGLVGASFMDPIFAWKLVISGHF